MAAFNSPYHWFENSAQNLANAYNQKRLPHGIIIAAAEGTGKLDFANHLIASLLCEQSISLLSNACGQCKSCLLRKADTHPDYYLLECLLDSKGKQKKSIGIDQVRNLTAKLVKMPQLGGWRIALISSVSALTTASFNALLKTLEEPGSDTLLLLLSDNLQAMPATIKSRCQIIQPELKTQPLIDWLHLQTNQPQDVIIRALKTCFNAPLKTQHYLLNDLESQQNAIYQLCDKILTNELTPNQLIEQSKLKAEEILAILPGYFYQLGKAIQTGTENPLYSQLPHKLPFQMYSKILEFNRAILAGSNLQSTIQLQEILIYWFESGRKIRLISIK